MRQQTLALAFHTLQAHEVSGERSGKRKAVGKRINGKNAATLKLPALQRQILKRCVMFSRARTGIRAYTRSFSLLSLFFQILYIELSLHVTAMNPFLII